LDDDIFHVKIANVDKLRERIYLIASKLLHSHAPSSTFVETFSDSSSLPATLFYHHHSSILPIVAALVCQSLDGLFSESSGFKFENVGLLHIVVGRDMGSLRHDMPSHPNSIIVTNLNVMAYVRGYQHRFPFRPYFDVTPNFCKPKLEDLKAPLLEKHHYHKRNHH
jgi:hypothetical protein